MRSELECPNVYKPVPAIRSIEFDSRAAQSNDEEVNQLTDIRTGSGIRWFDDGGNTRLIVIGAHIKETLARRDVIVEATVNIIVEAAGILLTDIVEASFLLDRDHETERSRRALEMT